jgi:hypothetical protein
MIKTKTNNKNNIGELLIITAFLIFIFLLWETNFLYPIKLFVVYLHESSHALATLITGGSIAEIDIGFNLGGKINTEGGNEIFIASAGYLGSLFYGLLLFISANLKVKGKWIFFVAIITLFIPLIFGKPSESFIILGFLTAVTLFLLATFLSKSIVAVITKILALSSCIYVLYDLKTDLFSKDMAINDSTILSNLIGVSSVLIASLWMVISIAAIYAVVKISYFKK